MKLFTDHPASVGESYFEHMGMATSFAVRMIGGGLACLLHGLLPFLFVRTGSLQVALLHERMVTKRRRKPLPAGEPAAPNWAGTFDYVI